MFKNSFGEIKKNLKVAVHFIKLVHQFSKSYLVIVILSSINKALMPLLSIIMLKYMIDELVGARQVDLLIQYVLITICGNAMLNLINSYLDTQVELANELIKSAFVLHLGKHILNMSFEHLEDPEILDMKEKAIHPINENNALHCMIRDLVGTLQTLISLTTLVTLIATINIFPIIMVIVISLLTSLISHKWQDVEIQFTKYMMPLWRRWDYFTILTTDFSYAKDVRLYNMAPLILKKINAFHIIYIQALLDRKNKGIKYHAVMHFNNALQVAVAYGYMIVQVIIGAISLGSFAMSISAINTFGNVVSSFLNNIVNFRQSCTYLDLYLQFEQLPERKVCGSLSIPHTNDDFKIEFKDVYFNYPRRTEYTLKNVSITISKHEKLSIVGHNGAGKTTFIKLLCRLYEPTEGEILLNGVNINEYDYNEYMKLLAVVFQDFKLFAFTLKENIAFEHAEHVSDEALLEVLRKAGLSSKMDELAQGMETTIYKIFDESGTEFSGGQGQKLAIARAIYRKSSLVILDEPTSALDPYAEHEVYLKFNELIDQNSALYISHRLSSCKFCDRIVVFDQGQIIEYGSHRELLSIKSGKYREMWEAQAQYYV